MADFIRIAHRGASGSFPENTRIAIEKAVEAGVDMIELDCQLSKDGHVVVFHDERLARTTGVKGQRVLALEEVMEILGGAVELNLELKSFPKGPLGIELKVLFILSHYDYLE